MTVIIDFPGPTTDSARADDFERLGSALARMVIDEGDELIGLMNRLLQVVQGQPLLVAAFAAMTIAELMLIRMPEMPVNEALFLRFRSFAVDVAEKMAEAQAR